MAEKEYIEREKIEKFFRGIYDCADLTFEPNDHCCHADDCGHCKWYEAKNAIQKRILSIPAADVKPVVRGHKVTHNRPIAGYWASGKLDGGWDGMEGRVWVEPIKDNPVDYCSECGKRLDDTFQNFCPNCGARMSKERKAEE